MHAVIFFFMNVFGSIFESACLSFCPCVRPSVCLPLRGRHCEVRVSVRLVSMGWHSVHLVGMGLGLGIGGVKRSACGVALNKEPLDPTSFSPKSVRPRVHPSVYKILVSVKVLVGVLSHF